jgi:prolipoprotein diacylglyceryltransferase
MYVALFALLWSMRDRTRFNGQLLCLYMILAGAVRLLVEFLRINPRILWCFSEAQVFSIVMIGFGFILYNRLAARTIAVEPRAATRAAP